jgi:hypothetical protein
MNKNIYLPSILLPTKRIIAIGDLHGDYRATLFSLRKANLIDSKNKWIGKDTIVVQLGDQLDRGGRSDYSSDEDSEFKIMNLFDRLHKQAKLSGGAVYSLIGNHELMNVLGDFSYTSNKGIEHFGSKSERFKYFKPGGKIAMKMAKNRNVIMRIGDWIFVHGGITPKLAQKYKIAEINNLMREYLSGNYKLEKNKSFRELFLNNGSLLWTRRYSEENPDCKNLIQALQHFGAKKLVVAHTPQEKINCRCNKSVWRIDVGMSKAFGKDNKIQVLEILDNGKYINIL